MFFRRSLSLLLVVVTFGVCFANPLVQAAEKKKSGKKRPAVSALPRIDAALHDALQSKQYAEAVKRINALLKQPKITSVDYLLYMKGRAETELGLFDRAWKTFEQLELMHPKSVWLARSHFGRADIRVRQRDYRAAGAIYQAQARRLLSDGRKDGLTGIYLEFADRYFEGLPAKDPSAKKKPDYKQALTYYTESLKLTPGIAKRRQIELRIARCRQELKQFPQAIAAYQKFLKDYTSKKTKADKRASAKLEVEARYQLGRAQLAAKQLAEARKTWQDFLAAEATKKAGGDLKAQAAYRMAATYGVPQPSSIGELELGVASLVKFLKDYSDHKLAPKAEYEIARSYAHHRRFEQAVGRLKSLIANKAYEKSPEVAGARMLLGQAYFAQKKFDEAIAAWRAFLDKHPTDKQWSTVQRNVVNTEYQMAEEQRRQRKYDLARELWTTFLNKYPLDSRAATVLLRFGQMKFAAAARLHADALKKAGGDNKSDERKLSPESKKLFAEAIADWNRLVSKYPDGNEASQAGFLIGVTLEERLGRLTDALEAFKKVKGTYAARAKQRIDQLTVKQLEIATERKFRTNEKATIRVTSRNIEKLSIKIYRVDMADYFRKMHLATGVESLDIALIDPDKSWEYKVEDFEKYRRLNNSVSIPIEGPGVIAVTVSSDKLEATTMVIIGDIDMVVKSSRNELFIFAQNMLTRKPAEGVSLLISDGKKVFAEETTGKDGVVQKSYEQLKTVSDLRVFAIREGHAASTVSSLAGLDFAVGLSARGYLYSDRPAYRSGELVNLKGIVRWVSEDRYTFKEGEKYKLDVYDSRGRVIYNAKVALNKFGTFAENFLLPEAAAQGDYRVQLYQPGKKQSYETRFRVHEAKIEPIQIVVDVPRNVYFRGEKIEGTIKLQYYYGSPLAGRMIQYRIADDRLRTATTDAAGKVKFSFETRRYSESQQLAIIVQYPERNLASAKTVYLATRGFGIAVKTLRNIYIAGETFDASVIVTDPAGKPVAADLKLELFEQTVVNNKRGEKLIESHTLKTEKKKGEARHTLRVEKAGRYIVRVTGTDRFKNPVSGSHTVIISGDEDKIRLRVLAEKHHYNVGDTAKVQLHWREAPALALVTFEGARVLGYRLVELNKGSNPLDVPLESKLAPNFVLSVVVMEKNHFHQADSEFNVSRKLNVVLKPSSKTVKPGDELTVEIITTDPQGKPVSTELSLALVQKNLLDYFGDSQSAVDEIFGRGYRQPSVRAAASSTFRYQPVTRAISGALLAEAERREIKRMEELAALKILDDDLEVSVVDDSPIAYPAESVDGDEEGKIESESSSGDASGVNVRAAGGRSRIRRRYGRGRSRQYGHYGHAANAPASRMVRSRLSAGKKLAGTARQRAMSERLQPDGKKAIPNILSGGEYPVLLPNSIGTNGRVREVLDGASPNALGFVFHVPVDANAGQRRQLNLLSNAKGTIVALNKAGEFQVINGLPAAHLEAMARDGLHILPKMGAAETGYWNPAVLTGDDGKATIHFRLPNRSTAWKLLSKGINAETLSGQAEAEIVSKSDLFGQIKTPLAFTEGDKADVMVEVHNSVLKKGETIEVVFKTKLGDRTTELKKTITATGPGIEEISFPVSITAGEKAEFELTVTSGNRKETSKVTVPVQPYGMKVFATASGSSAQNTIVFIEHDKKLPVQNPGLEIIIGPSVNRTLIDAVLGGGISHYERIMPASRLERAVSDVLGGVGLLKTIGSSRNDDSPEATALSGRVQSALAQLTSAQRDDGGWSWSGRPKAQKSDRYLSSRIVWALASARKAGFAVPQETFDKGVGYLKSAFTASSRSDREGQAILLHGLSEAGQGDFAFANRLYRQRNNLSASGLLHVALSLVNLDRKEMAADLLKLVKISVDPKTANQRPGDAAYGKVIPWMQSGVELRALYLLALEEIAPADPKASQLADWLLAARRGSRWTPEKANGPAVLALADWFSRTKHTDEKYTLSVYANGRLVEKFAVDPAKDGSRKLDIPADALVAGKPQRINIDIEGRGRFSYSAVLGGFVPAEKLVNTTNLWRVKRTYQPALRMLDGKPIPRGFGGLTGGYKTFVNPLTQLPMGERGEVQLNVYRTYNRGRRNEQLDYLIVTEPIPAGSMVLTESIKGGFERYEITPGAITFYIGDRRHVGAINYTLTGYLPGSYRAAPTLVRSFYRPERMAVSKTKSLAVLARGKKSKDKYRLTPQELFEFGKRLAAKGEYKQASVYLTPLFRDYQLQEKVYREVVQLLFRAALDADGNPSIVEFFEIIKEKYPDVELDFDAILKVGEAYRELGEYERSYLVFRATLEAAFLRESQIAGFLDDRGEFLRSVQVMERLLRNYPAESYIASATYALAQEVYGKASEAAGDKKLRAAKISKVELIATSIGMLDHFLSTWTKDPASDQAAFSMASAYLDLEQYPQAISRCEKFAKRYPKSELLDSYWYVIGYSRFALGEHEAALEMCRKVAETIRKNPKTGLDVPAANKWQAVYIMGQVFHSLGKPAEAIAEYKRVKTRFADAAEAIDFFMRKDISLPEVSMVKPGDETKIPLKYRNVPKANVKVYRIDLLKFGLMKRNLNRISAINLAGIRPYHESTLELGDGNDYGDRKKPLSLPLKDEGAYLVVCRGGNLYASGLVLVSPLELEIQEDAQSGRVRVTVKDRTTSKYLGDVHVKVIGSSNKKFISGETDLRGIFAADAIQGSSTVIAKAGDNRYAFYRGKTHLGTPSPASRGSSRPSAQKKSAKQPASGKGQLLQNIQRQNGSFNRFQRKQYRGILGNTLRGVKAKGAY